MPASRVLVVDDEPNLREISRVFLEDAGFTVSEAESGRLAAEAIVREAFDAVVTDLRMPTASGEALIQWILLNRPAMKTRILVVSGEGLSPELAAFVSRTGITFLAKPYVRDQLLDAVCK